MEPNQTQYLQEIQAQIEAVYNETMQKLNEIETHKKEIIRSYIKELEQQKINLLRKHLDEHNK